MQKTPLYEAHVKSGARIIDFGGWLMPVQYSSILDEHQTTRTSVTLFDTCHMGEFTVEGKDALDFLQYALAADFSKLESGQAKYSFLLNENGGVIDDLIVFKKSLNEYMVCVNAGTILNDFQHFTQRAGNFEVCLKNVSSETAKIDVQGPKTESLMKKFITGALPERFTFRNDSILGIPVILSRTGYTGEDGVELFFASENAEKLWYALLEAGKEFGAIPAGLGARDSLRLEAGYPLYGHELTEKITPLEAGLNFAVNLNKDKFIGKAALTALKEKGLARKLVALEINDKGIPREGYEIIAESKTVGYVTSGTFSPTFKKGIAMAYIDTDQAKENSEINVKIRNNLHKATIKKKPLYPFKGVQNS